MCSNQTKACNEVQQSKQKHLQIDFDSGKAVGVGESVNLSQSNKYWLKTLSVNDCYYNDSKGSGKYSWAEMIGFRKN